MEVTVDSITCGDSHICSLLTENAVAGCCSVHECVKVLMSGFEGFEEEEND